MPKTTNKRPNSRKAPPPPPATRKTPFIQMTSAERSRIRIDELKAKSAALKTAAQQAAVFPPPIPAPPKPPSKLKKGVQAIADIAKRNKKTAIFVTALGALGVGLDYTKNQEYTPPKAPDKKPAKPQKRSTGIGTSPRPK
jgi:hypothetical protein